MKNNRFTTNYSELTKFQLQLINDLTYFDINKVL